MGWVKHIEWPCYKLCQMLLFFLKDRFISFQGPLAVFLSLKTTKTATNEMNKMSKPTTTKSTTPIKETRRWQCDPKRTCFIFRSCEHSAAAYLHVCLHPTSSPAPCSPGHRGAAWSSAWCPRCLVPTPRPGRSRVYRWTYHHQGTSRGSYSLPCSGMVPMTHPSDMSGHETPFIIKRYC